MQVQAPPLSRSPALSARVPKAGLRYRCPEDDAAGSAAALRDGADRGAKQEAEALGRRGCEPEEPPVLEEPQGTPGLAAPAWGGSCGSGQCPGQSHSSSPAHGGPGAVEGVAAAKPTGDHV
ncbi:uncharacterized protein LOC144576907 isoform X1 [Callithrix jacchus]